MSKIEVNQISSQCGSTLTIGQSGDTVTLACGASQTGFGRTGTVDWDTTAKTAGFTAVSGEGYFVNTAGGAVTVTLPATPSSGNIVSVSDYNGTAATNAITIARNGSNINGNASDFEITKADSAITFVYVDGTVGWTSVQTSNITDTQNPFIVASGGTETTCGDYKIHTFTGPGTFTVTNAGSTGLVDYLVVAGGGGSGANSCASSISAGGGGAGGYRESEGCGYSSSPLGACVAALPVTAQGYPITVGAGGAGGTGDGGNGSQGVNSVFSSITSTGGGYGMGRSNPVVGGGPGGSGGGMTGNQSGAGGTGNTPPVSPPQGNPGGSNQGPAPSANVYGSAGGGGAGAAANPVSTQPDFGSTPGGNGVASSITGSSVTRAGGGGGGGANAAASPETTTNDGGAGGSGGGGAGGSSVSTVAGTAGTANTGGGAGAPGAGLPDNTARNGAQGGSGIVIIRYKYQ